MEEEEEEDDPESYVLSEMLEAVKASSTLSLSYM